jgi:hypothetical protein
VTVIAVAYFCGSAIYTSLLMAWMFGRNGLLAFIEDASPSATLGPALLEEIPGIATTYFVVMAGLCFAVGLSLWKLHRWSWFVTCFFAVLTFVLDAGLFAHMLRHLPIVFLALGILRFGFLVWILAYMSRTSVRAAFGLARRQTAAA